MHHHEKLGLLITGVKFVKCVEQDRYVAWRHTQYLTITTLYRIMTLIGNQLEKLGHYCEKTAIAFFDAVVTTARQCTDLLEKRKLAGNL